MFTKDNRTENFLTQMGVDYRYSNNIAFEDLKDNWNAENIARPVPLREEAIVEYASLMEQGSAAPAPVLFEGAGGGFSVLDGIQRLSAAQLIGTTKFSAYIVTTDSADMVAAVRVLSNARLQGRAEPPEWTKRRAVEVLVLGRGLSIDEVARMGGWKPADVSRLASVIEWGTAITSIGGPELPDNMIDAVSSRVAKEELRLAPKPIAEFLNVVKAAKFSTSDAEPYIEDFFAAITKPSRRHEMYEERLKEFRELPEVQTRILGRKTPGMRRDVVLLRTLKAAHTLLEEIIANGDEIPYVDEFFRHINQIEEKLKEIAPNRKPVSCRVPADMWSKK